jgi:hypothetical protein
LFNQGNDSLDHGMTGKAVSWVGLELARGGWQRLCQLQNSPFGLRLGKAYAFCKLIPVPLLWTSLNLYLLPIFIAIFGVSVGYTAVESVS